MAPATATPDEAGDVVSTELLPEEQAAAESNQGLSPTFEELALQPGYESGGLSNDGSGALEIYWHGAVGAEAQSIIDKAKASGQDVRIVPLPYSYDEMFQHSMQIAGIAEDLGIVLMGFGPNREHTAIELMGPTIAAESDKDRSVLMDAIEESDFPDDIDIVFLDDAGTNSVMY